MYISWVENSNKNFGAGGISNAPKGQWLRMSLLKKKEKKTISIENYQFGETRKL